MIIKVEPNINDLPAFKLQLRMPLSKYKVITITYNQYRFIEHNK